MTTATKQHTPGPWTQHGTANGHQFMIYPQGETGDLVNRIAEVNHIVLEGANRYGADNSEAVANAALIAAAPALLAALEALLNEYEWGRLVVDDEMDTANKAIRNARAALELATTHTEKESAS